MGRDASPIVRTDRSATNMNMVLMQAEVLRPSPAQKVDEIENTLREWKEN